MGLKQLWTRFADINDPGDLLELRQDLILEVGAGAIFVGWIVMLSAIRYNGEPANLAVAALLFATAIGSIWMRGKNYLLALYWLLGGLLAATALHKSLFPSGFAQFFFPITVVISGLLVSNLSVYVIAILASLICFGLAALQGVSLWDSTQVWSPVLLILMTAFAAWLSSRQLHSVLGWMRSSYAQAREWLEQLRDERMAQARTIKYLEEAYVRIEKLNYLLLEARQSAEEARQLKAEFAANISHELRTPLNVIIGFSETMANAPETYPSVTWTPILRGDIDEIYRSSSHLLSLIDDILDLSALEVRRLGLNLASAQIGAVIEDAVGVVHGLYHAKRLYLKIDTQADLPALLVDATRIRQVLINLLSNACRFTTSGGVTIRTRLVEDHIQVAVTDTGIGIAAKDVPRVFEEFGQVDGTISRVHEGTGLGVPLSKRLVEMHGGEMWLESQVGQGTTFYFSLPCTQPVNKADGSGERELQQTPRPGPAFRKSILVAQASPMLLHSMRRQLSLYDLIEVPTPAHLSELIERHRPAALLLNQPEDHDKPQLQPWLSATPRELPVLRAALKDNLWLAHELGIVDYLIKPISREQLLETIQKVPGEIHTILIVDDDPQLVGLFERMLASSGVERTILKASSGAEARQALSAQAVDLLLLDLRLPDGSGLDVLRLVKSGLALRRPAVIMISAQYPEELVASTPLSLQLYRRENASLTETLNYLRAVVEELPKGSLGLAEAAPEPPEAGDAEPAS